MSFILDPFRFAVGSAYEDEVLADSPLLLWKMNETSGTTVTDSSGNARDGTYTNSPTLAGAAGYPDGSSVVYFAGNQYAGSNAALVSDGTYTVECWFIKDAYFPGQTGNINSVVGDLSSSSNGFLARYDGDTTTLTTYIPAGGYSTLTCTTALDTLYHYALTSDGTTCRLYLDGSEVTNGAISASGFNLSWRVARSEDGRYFNGSVGWVAVYPTALSATRIGDHFAAA